MTEMPKTPDQTGEVSDGSSAGYYKLPPRCKQLQDLIAAKDMNAQIGEVFRACYRYGQVAHSPKKRDLKKMLFYIKAELKRVEQLEKLTGQEDS